MVAHKVLGDTLSVLARELVLNITSAVGVHWKWKEQTAVNGHGAACSAVSGLLFLFFKISVSDNNNRTEFP